MGSDSYLDVSPLAPGGIDVYKRQRPSSPREAVAGSGTASPWRASWESPRKVPPAVSYTHQMCIRDRLVTGVPFKGGEFLRGGHAHGRRQHEGERCV